MAANSASCCYNLYKHPFHCPWFFYQKPARDEGRGESDRIQRMVSGFLKKTVALDPTMAQEHMNPGWAYAKAEEFSLAIKSFERGRSIKHSFSINRHRILAIKCHRTADCA